MNAIIPLNIAALRVSANDHSNVVTQFKGRAAIFEQMPFVSTATQASTGDMILQPLESNSSPQNPLGVGIHLHWELPDYFRRGEQPAEGGDVVFPAAPNRWLVIRYLSLFDSGTGQYGAAQSRSWIVESDFVATQLTKDTYAVVRPAVSVPLPTNPPQNTQPYMYMGRVVDYASWNPSSESPQNYLPAFNGSDGKPLYLTSIGFVGPSFSAYYPECCSVFGFWDHFKDVSTIYQAIVGNTPIQFKVSYQVIGWINEPASDPLTNVAQLVKAQYNQYVFQCQAENVAVDRTPADEFLSIASQDFRWDFHQQDISYTLNVDQTLNSLNVPQRTLCGGVMQEIVWNMLSNPQTRYFLNNAANVNSPALWTDTVELAVGNTTVEALSALLKMDMGDTTDDPDLLDNYEYLLNALQLGLLHDLEQQGNSLITLEEECHAKAFSQLSGGYSWVVEQKQDSGTPADADQEVTLPLALAEQLSQLNQAQKKYDQGRAALDMMRKQVFMDWIRYVKMYMSGVVDPYVNINNLTNFLMTSNSGEIKWVASYGNSVGILFYMQDPVTAEVTGIQQPAADGSLAAAIWTQYQAMTAMLAQYPDWQLRIVAASPFWMPTDPVLVMEGDRLEPVRRNGPGPNISVRLSGELLNRLQFKYQGNTFVVATGDLSGLPNVSAATPMSQEVKALIGEAYLLIPMLARAAADALKAKGGTGNPAVSSYADLITSLNNAQGGQGSLTGGPGAGVFATIHAGEPATANLTETVSTPLAISVTFTNDAANGWAPDAIAWNTQTALPEFTADRNDPFLPVFLIWTAQIDPLTRNSGLDYAANNLTNYFSLDADAVDYQYQMPAAFTTKVPVKYDSSVTLSKTTTNSLTNQIDNYVANYPTDTEADAELEAAKTVYESRKIISQGLSGFNLEQTLRTFIPRVTVENLVKGTSRDEVTYNLNESAGANAKDDWYDFGFNSQTPIATGLLAQHNFGPLRAGFAEIFSLEIVDVFGQRMKLNTSSTNADGSLQTIVAASLKPASGDTANNGKIFLPPRLLTPARLWFNWLSAMHDNQVSDDFVEMNSHPATSPVCGWVMPNHLDNSLFFYDAGGAAVGSFGVEHGDLKYRTRAGNLDNPQDLLDEDIGPKGGAATVNAHLAVFMWYINGKDANFLLDLMATIENSDQFINPVNFPQDASLAVFIGRPLALTRAVIGLETSGNLLPLSQADTTANDPFPLDVKNNRFKYSDRQQTSSAKLADIRFPLRLGDLSNIDDGLVGYLIDHAGADPYDTFYSPAAPVQGGHGVVQPSPNIIELTLNATPIAVTMLIDPRAPVHATTGILPVEERRIPPDQYAQTMRSLAVTFFTHPMLSLRDQLIVPLPQESAYEWSWIAPGNSTALPLQPNSANEFAIFGYSPQSLLEGWLRLETDDENSQ